MVETLGRGIVQTQMGCGQGRRRREVGQLAQIWRRRELLRGRAQTEWNSVWRSTGHLQTWRQRKGRDYSLHGGLIPEGDEGDSAHCQPDVKSVSCSSRCAGGDQMWRPFGL